MSDDPTFAGVDEWDRPIHIGGTVEMPGDPTEPQSEHVTTVEILVGGQPINSKPPECHHLAFTQQVVVANLVDEAGVHVAWRAQVKIRCAECGTPFRFRLTAAGTPDTLTSDDRFTLGALCDPTPEHDRPDEWAAFGGVVESGMQRVAGAPRQIGQDTSRPGDHGFLGM